MDLLSYNIPIQQIMLIIKKTYIKFQRYLNIFFYYIFNLDYRRLLLLLKINKVDDTAYKNLIIFDNFESLSNTCLRLVYFPILSKFYQAKLKYFNLNFNPIFKNIYKNIPAQQIIIQLNANQKKELLIKMNRILKNLRTKQQIMRIAFNKINIGIDIYESYLIRHKEATINEVNKNKKLRKIIYEALTNSIFWRDYLKKENVVASLLSHRCYIETNIINKICIENKIPVFTLSGIGDGINRWNSNKLNLFKLYPKIFKALSQTEKKHGIETAKKQLKKRFGGKPGVNMTYSKISAFSKKIEINEDLFKDGNKINILICTHCFYDNPHAYGKNFFVDFYEWILYLAKISKKTNYNWYIKPHPDYLPGTLDHIYKIMKSFNNIQLLDPLTSFHQLIGKVDKILTVYGSVAHELPLLGFEVINCTDQNPHRAYNFSYTPKNISSLTKKLLNLKKENQLIDEKKIYEFYYIHYYFFKYNLIKDTSFLKKNTFNLEVFNKFFKKKSQRMNLEKKTFTFLDQKKIMTIENFKLDILKKIRYEH